MGILECSVPAVKQHIQKLRRDAEGLSGAGADAQGKMETPTPNESFAVGTKRKRTGGGKRATKRTKGGDASAAAPTPIVEIPPAAAKGEEGGDKEEE